MSTYYYMVCDSCKERVASGSQTAGGWSGLGEPAPQNGLAIWYFIGRHINCHPLPRLANEHEDGGGDGSQNDIYEYRELTLAECKEKRQC